MGESVVDVLLMTQIIKDYMSEKLIKSVDQITISDEKKIQEIYDEKCLHLFEYVNEIC